MIGYSIKLPLTRDMIELLEAADLDPSLIREVFEASEDRSRGIFKEALDQLPIYNRLRKVYLCEGCRPGQTRLAWTEELSQLYNFVNVLERMIDSDLSSHGLWWLQVMVDPTRLRHLRFREIPWPVRDTWLTVRPSQITKSEVRRFLFSRCTLRIESTGSTDPTSWATRYLNGLKQRWDPRFFKRHLSYDATDFTTDQNAIIEVVSMIEGWLRDFETVHWM